MIRRRLLFWPLVLLDLAGVVLLSAWVVFWDRGEADSVVVDGKLIPVDAFMVSEGLRVEGNLDLSGTAITHLPERLTVGGFLDLRGTPITVLSPGLTVGGDLYLSGTTIAELPKGLTVGGDLYLSETRIGILPPDLKVNGSLLF